MVLPSDLSDDVLVAGGSSLSDAMKSLNLSGWNTKGNIYRTSLARLRLLLAVFRGQVLEITMAHYEDGILSRAKYVIPFLIKRGYLSSAGLY